MSSNFTSSNAEGAEPLARSVDSNAARPQAPSGQPVASGEQVNEAASQPLGEAAGGEAFAAQDREVWETAGREGELRGVTAPEGTFEFNPPAGLTGRKAKPGADPFWPEGVQFYGVSPNLLKVRVITTLITAAIFVLPGVVMALLLSPWIWIYVVAAVALFVWLLWLIPRQVRALGYAETESDLLIRSGIMWKSLTVVPYGRLQYVDVSEGPIARAFGIATVQLHTASASTDATIPGLAATEAARLRTSLAQRGQSEMAGI